MKPTTIALVLLALGFSLPAEAAGKKRTIHQLIQEVAEAYMAKDLGRLDAEGSYPGGLRVIIRHSILEDGPGVKQARTWKQAERWLKGREREDGLPFREARPLIGCRRGVCTYDLDGGISHNHLYLKAIYYGYRSGSPYIKTMVLLDGD